MAARTKSQRDHWVARQRCCRRCGEDAWVRNGPPRANGYLPWACAPCRVKNALAWQARNPELRRRYVKEGVRRFSLRSHGITEADFTAMREGQGGACAICSELFSRTPHIDHCHATGIIRGLLCGSCNRAIGLLKDRPERLEAAALYLRRHSERKLILVEVS